ncbi:MAG: TatD family hydrolase [Atopobiaceae bacterium]
MSDSEGQWAQTLEDGVLFHDKKGRPKDYPRPPYPLIDTHGHLTAFWEAAPAHAVARAALAGVCRLVVPFDPADDARDAEATLRDLEGWLEEAHGLIGEIGKRWEIPAFEEPGIAAATLPDETRIVAGAHPYGAADFLGDPSVKEALGKLIRSPRCVGIGEIGLDYTCDVDRAQQKEAFRQQLVLAGELGLPVELHIRDAKDDEQAEAHADALRVLEEAGVPEAGADLHCYTGNRDVLAPYLELGCSVAFGGALTFRKSDDIRAAALSAPQGRLLSETDCPYMAPVPMRGCENEPAMVGFTAALLSDLRLEAGLAQDRLETYRALWENGSALFYR